ncbi:AAA family ATPase [Cellulomonas bogoriensis]|uniref:ATPase n=1 Tax=Cellulomonas bogoriensis 69B4 = DSM 16987 TaxID=1386082 RepID=A0A0A0BUD5_9CELL|nr:MoxR family ATPase [Cellulomonas bogoriensis]KGM11282.1 ATPase [Cellulomonas bogoriensis 69B4 = DSM 16987]
MHSLPARPEVEAVTHTARALTESLGDVVRGRPALVRLTVSVLLAGGHLLLEDVPGVGKTTTAKALAQAIGGQVGRIQFTPDLLPGDVTGVSIYHTETHDLQFRPGPVFAHVVIADEINRASPKTQSALLECMQERQVTVDGTTHPLPDPFMVVATQNPVGMDGTYALPEAQRDRFMARAMVGYPDPEDELDMLERQEVADPLASVHPVTSAAEIAHHSTVVRRIYSAPSIKEYVVALVRATREHPMLRLGASPRAGIQLLRAAKAVAVSDGRDHVLPDDVQELVLPVLAHRLLPSADARLAGSTVTETLTQVLAHVPVPVGRTKRALRVPV